MIKNIFGHESEIKFLENSLKANEYSHSYLFTGPEGIGKCLLAKEFARCILKVEDLSLSSDFTYIKKREDKKNILVEQIREDVIENINQAPFSGDKKVYIIDDGEFLNEASQNALLKTLEEPPNHVIVIIVSSNTSTLLPTIMSRVNKINFNKLEDSVVDKFIKEKFNIELSSKMLKYIDGSIGEAIYLSNEEVQIKFKGIDDIYNDILEKNIVTCLLKKDITYLNEKHMLDYLQFLFFENKNYLCVKIIEKTKQRLKYNGNYDIVIDNMMLKCIESI